MVRRCMECCKVVNKDVCRGLCRKCYSDKAVRDRYPRLNLGCHHETARDWDEIDLTRLKRFFHRGHSDKYIAERLRRSVGSVCKRRQRLGLIVSRARQNYHRKIAWSGQKEVKNGYSERAAGSGQLDQ